MRRFLWIIPLLAVLASCSSGVSSGFVVVIDGKWVGLLLSNTAFAPLTQKFSGNVTMNITQDELTGAIAGVVSITDPETNCWVGGVIDPTQSFVTGNKVLIVIEDNGGATIIIDGNASNSTITAIYTSAGSGGSTTITDDMMMEVEVECADHSGTFSATKAG